MRLVVCFILLLFAIGWLATSWGPAASSDKAGDQPRIEHVWRRTAQGWERAVWRDRIRVVPYEPALHPAVVAAFEVIAAMTIGAYAWSTASDQRQS